MMTSSKGRLDFCVSSSFFSSIARSRISPLTAYSALTMFWLRVSPVRSEAVTGASFLVVCCGSSGDVEYIELLSGLPLENAFLKNSILSSHAQLSSYYTTAGSLLFRL
ncbi:unnamed protein product [Heterosigma akashiwo]